MQRSRAFQFKASPGKQYLEKRSIPKIGLMEWLKVKALSSVLSAK
jgi:hypothetical protein